MCLIARDELVQNAVNAIREDEAGSDEGMEVENWFVCFKHVRKKSLIVKPRAVRVRQKRSYPLHVIRVITRILHQLTQQLV